MKEGYPYDHSLCPRSTGKHEVVLACMENAGTQGLYGFPRVMFVKLKQVISTLFKFESK
jgi:hypothetical protein